MTAPPSETFDKAVALIERHGWCQGAMRGPGGEYCADGALWYAAGVLIEDDVLVHDYPTYDAARLASRRLLQARGMTMGLVGYNDHPGRTKEEVVGMLRWMAQHAQVEGSRRDG